MKKKYDVIIVGAGPTGIFTAYELMLKAPEKSVLLIDKGFDIYDRKCPILSGNIKQCPKDIYGNSGCKPSCSMTSGLVAVVRILMENLISPMNLVVIWVNISVQMKY